MMKMIDEFSQYLDLLKQGLGNNAKSNPSRHRNFIDYCQGLMLPLERKSVEPMAAAMDYKNVRSRHQGMHHFVAESPWSDRAILNSAWKWLDERMPEDQDVVWIVVVCEQASLLIDHRLYLPKSWTDVPERCKAVGVPEGIGFATKPQISLEQIRAACKCGVRAWCAIWRGIGGFRLWQ